MPADPARPLLVIDPAIERGDIAALCDRLATLLGGRAGVVVCDLGGASEPSVVVVEALARLRLTARRLGADIRLRDPHARLRPLLALTGLRGVIPEEDNPGGSALVPHGQAEQREQPLHVEEVGHPTNPAG